MTERRLTCAVTDGHLTLSLGGKTLFRDASATFIAGGATYSTTDFHTHEVSEDGRTVVCRDCPGFGGTFTLRFTEERRFTEEACEGGTAVSLTCEIAAAEGVTVNCIEPLSIPSPMPGGTFVRIPFDNDMWVEPNLADADSLAEPLMSYEAAALFDETGAGLILGSVQHTVWKTGIRLSPGGKELTVIAGNADEGTRDNSPHGSVSGTIIRAPKLFLGRFDDWREGLTAFGKTNAAEVPPVPSVPDVPFGYNSWGVLQSKVSFAAMNAVSDYIRTYLQPVWQSDGAPVYVNIDSFWDFLVHNDPEAKAAGLSLEDALKAYVARCRANGQKAGIYFTPFTAWHGDEDSLRRSRVEGAPEYTYYDCAVKKTDGSGLYGKLDGGWALDPTHPAVLARLAKKLNTFIELGFEYVKLDFMTHGAVEGQHYDPAVSTGLEAYCRGMAMIREICDGKLFVNLSIAPLFPYAYADGRRISCDAFASLDNTQHVLSYLTACFWEGELYPYPDPDHLLVWGKDGSVTEGEARCRVTAGAISGTSFLIGEDLYHIDVPSLKHERIVKLFGNPGIVAAAKLHRMFRPLNAKAGQRCADTFFCDTENARYLAVFRFDEDAGEIDLPAGISADSAVELWRNEEIPLSNGRLRYRLPGHDATLFRIPKK